MQHLLRYFILVLVCSSCRAKETPPVNVVQVVKETGQLITAEYTLSKIIKADDNKTWYKIGNRKILMSCEALVRAGVDLQQVNEKNVQIIDDSISLTIPLPRFFSLNIPPERIKIQYQQVDLLRDPFSAEEREALLAQAEAQIQRAVDSLGILQTAQDNATLYLQTMLRSAGFAKVSIQYKQTSL